MTGQIKTLDTSGHTTIDWDTESTNTSVNEGPVSPETAIEAFTELQDKGFMGVSTDPATKEKEQIRKFVPREHPDVTMVPPMAGGTR